ncbi:hypothetical protein [Curtobacterium sp. MCSS17_016]|uniref:hypothetical protein n=1 Tax=Curtobacterium sp. MCSS17_016 TaxID=2175644 RepID=UPI000DAA1792|nr:hypothetical protein [Curtobacterium sp. MCSS17_016]WIE81390.1 hypothetical protein DEJ19_019335 [Curtobacterium sp. MCSS17_016]
MTAGLETADAHQQLALSMERVINARRELLAGLDDLVAASHVLDRHDLIGEDAEGIRSDVFLATTGLPLVRSMVVATLSTRISGHRTHTTPGADHP